MRLPSEEILEVSRSVGGLLARLIAFRSIIFEKDEAKSPILDDGFVWSNEEAGEELGPDLENGLFVGGAEGEGVVCEAMKD